MTSVISVKEELNHLDVAEIMNESLAGEQKCIGHRASFERIIRDSVLLTADGWGKRKEKTPLIEVKNLKVEFGEYLFIKG